MTMTTIDNGTDVAGANSVGTLLRDWRARRRFSQLDLACEAEVSVLHFFALNLTP